MSDARPLFQYEPLAWVKPAALHKTLVMGSLSRRTLRALDHDQVPAPHLTQRLWWTKKQSWVIHQWHRSDMHGHHGNLLLQYVINGLATTRHTGKLR